MYTNETNYMYIIPYMYIIYIFMCDVDPIKIVYISQMYAHTNLS